MADRIRVLYISHKAECGGAEKSLLDLLASLNRSRYEPHMVTSGPGELAYGARQLRVPVHFMAMDFHGKVQRLIGMLKASKRLSRLQRRYRIDLIHANTLHAGYISVLARTGLPLIWHLRDLDYPLIGRLMAARADLLIANSKATADMFPEQWLRTGRVRVIYNGIAQEFFQPVQPNGFLHRELGLEPKVPLVGVVGRLSPWKGQEDFIRAAALVKSDAHFLIIGGQPFIGNKSDRGYPEHLAEMARALEVGGRVHLLGHRKNVAQSMAELSMLVHPSRKPEPFGRDLAECQALGIPVIGSAAGGVLEIIENGVNGLLVPPKNPIKISDAIDRLLRNPDLASELGKRGRRSAMEKFTTAQHAHQIEQVYDSSVQKPV